MTCFKIQYIHDWLTTKCTLFFLPLTTFCSACTISVCHSEPCNHANKTQTLWFVEKKRNFKYRIPANSYSPFWCTGKICKTMCMLSVSNEISYTILMYLEYKWLMQNFRPEPRIKGTMYVFIKCILSFASQYILVSSFFFIRSQTLVTKLFGAPLLFICFYTWISQVCSLFKCNYVFQVQLCISYLNPQKSKVVRYML